MVMIRSSSGRNEERTFNVVVFGTRPAGDQDVDPAANARVQEPGHGVGDSAERDEVFRLVRVRGELSDGESRAVDGEGRDDGVDPGTVGQPSIDIRRGLVDSPADLGDDLLDRVTKLSHAVELR